MKNTEGAPVSSEQSREEQPSQAQTLEGMPSFAEHLVENIDYNTPLSREEQNEVRERALDLATDIDNDSREWLDDAAKMNLPLGQQDRVLNREIASEEFNKRLLEDMASDISNVGAIVEKLQKNYDTFRKEFFAQRNRNSENSNIEDIGEEDTGYEDAPDAWDTGYENVGEGDTGYEDTGYEGVGPDPDLDPTPTPLDDPGEPDPTPPTSLDFPPDSGPTPEPKDAERFERSDKRISEDIANDVGAGEIRVAGETPRSTYEARGERVNRAVIGEDDTVQNRASEQAESIQDQISPENDYSQDRGYSGNLVEPDEAAQAAADAAELPADQAPTGGEELDNVLKDLGIN